MWTCKNCDERFEIRLKACSNCGAFGTLVQTALRSAGIPPRTRGSLISARDLAKVDRPTLPLSPEWREAFGPLPAQFGLLVYGKPGQGKSHWLMQFASELAKLSPVLYVASECGQSNATIQMLNRLEIHSERIFISSAISASEMISDLDECGAQYLIIDSITYLPDLSLVELSELAEKKRIGVGFSLQTRRDGEFKGNNCWAHWVDAVARIEDRIVHFEKNRFGPLKSVSFNTDVSVGVFSS